MLEMKNNKGFTLVEIIVVLVILGILAAATIPSMMGFVEQAKQKAISAEGRSCFVAAQAFTTERASNAKTIDKQDGNFYNNIMLQIDGQLLVDKNSFTSGIEIATTGDNAIALKIDYEHIKGDEGYSTHGHITPANSAHALHAYLKDDCQGFISDTQIKDGKVVKLTYTRDHQQVTFDNGAVTFETRTTDDSAIVTDTVAAEPAGP